LADRRRFRHPRLAVDQQRDRAERIDREIFALLVSRRERQQLEPVRQPDFLQRPERPKGPGVGAVIERDHGQSLSS